MHTVDPRVKVSRIRSQNIGLLNENKIDLCVEFKFEALESSKRKKFFTESSVTRVDFIGASRFSTRKYFLNL